MTSIPPLPLHAAETAQAARAAAAVRNPEYRKLTGLFKRCPVFSDLCRASRTLFLYLAGGRHINVTKIFHFKEKMLDMLDDAP